LEEAQKETREARIRRAVERLEEAVADLGGDTGTLREYGAEIAGIASDLAAQTRQHASWSFADFTNTGIEEALAPVGEPPLPGPPGGELRLVPAAFLERGADVQRAVARIALATSHQGLPTGAGWGTGFLVGPSLFLTTHHAIPTREFAGLLRVHFDPPHAGEGTERASDSYSLDPESSFHTSPDLDYTLVRVRAKAQVDDVVGFSRLASPGARCGWLPLSSTGSFHPGQRFRIVQHPTGRRKEVSLAGNEIQRLFHNVVRYSSESEPASSGSPVFDEWWRLVAMHHAHGTQEGGRWVNDQAIRIDRIAEDLRSAFAERADVLGELSM
jgi:hypothetical protein